MSDKVTLNQKSEQKPILVFNNNQTYNNVPSKIESEISISYFFEPNNEPCYKVITGQKYDRSISNPVNISIGGVSVSGYLSSFSFKLYPNSLVKADATFKVYNPITGNFTGQNSNDSSYYDTSNSSGIAHYWSAQFLSGSTNLSPSLIQSSYSVDLGIKPIYSLSNPFPCQVYSDAIVESLDILTESQFNVNYTGNIFENIYPGLQNLNIQPISNVFNGNNSNNIMIPLTGFIQQEAGVEISTDNLILHSLSFSRTS